MTTATAEPSLRMLSLEDLHDRSRFIRVPHVPMFDAHPKISDNKPEVTIDDLKLILANINRRIAEYDVFPILIAGHTCDPGPSCREQDQPDMVGYAINWSLGSYKGKPALFADMYIERSMYKVARRLPFRSVERHISDEPERNFIDYVAMLASPPQRDLGILTYSRENEDVVRYGRAFPNAFAKGNREHRKRKDRKYKDETHIDHDRLKSMVREHLSKMRKRKPAEPDKDPLRDKTKKPDRETLGVDPTKPGKAKYAMGDGLDPKMGNKPARPNVMDNVKSAFGGIGKVIGPGSSPAAPPKAPKSNPSAQFSKPSEPANPRQVTVNTGDSFTMGGRTYHVAGFDSGAGKIHFKNPETGLTRTATHAEFQDALRSGRLAHTPTPRALPAPLPQAAQQAPAAPSRALHPVADPQPQARGMQILDRPAVSQPVPVAPAVAGPRNPTKSAPAPPKTGNPQSPSPAPVPATDPVIPHPQPPVPVGPAPGSPEPEILYEGDGSSGAPVPYQAPGPRSSAAPKPAAQATPKVRPGKPPKLNRPAAQPLKPTHVAPTARPGGPMVAASKPRDVHGIPHQPLAQDLADGEKPPLIRRKQQPKVTNVSRSVPTGAGSPRPKPPQVDNAAPAEAPPVVAGSPAAPGPDAGAPPPASTVVPAPDSAPATEPQEAAQVPAPARDPREVIVGQKHPGKATEAAKVSLRAKQPRRPLNLGPTAGEAFRGLMTGVTGRFGDWWYDHAKTPLWKGHPADISKQPVVSPTVGIHGNGMGGAVWPNLRPGYGGRNQAAPRVGPSVANGAPWPGSPAPRKAQKQVGSAPSAPAPVANPFGDGQEHLRDAYAAHADRFGEQAKSPHRKAKVVQAADLLAGMEAKNSIDPKEFQELHSLHADFVRAEGREPTPAQLIQEYEAQKQAKANPQDGAQATPSPGSPASPAASEPAKPKIAPRLHPGGKAMGFREREDHIKTAAQALASVGHKGGDKLVGKMREMADRGPFENHNDLIKRFYEGGGHFVNDIANPKAKDSGSAAPPPGPSPTPKAEHAPGPVPPTESKADRPISPAPESNKPREWWHSSPVEGRPAVSDQGAPPPGPESPPSEDPYTKNLERLYAAHFYRGRKGFKSQAQHDTVVRAANMLAKRQRADAVEPNDFQDLHRLSEAIYREKGLEPTPAQLLSAWVKGKGKTSQGKSPAPAGAPKGKAPTAA